MPERDARGRFVQGHKGIGGRPPRAVEERYMRALVQAMPIKQFLKVCRVHAAKAEAGDLPTFRTFLERLLGKATENVNLLATLVGGVSVEVVERIVSADGNSDTAGDSATPASGSIPG